MCVIYIYIHTCIYIYINTYVQRERIRYLWDPAAGSCKSKRYDSHYPSSRSQPIIAHWNSVESLHSLTTSSSFLSMGKRWVNDKCVRPGYRRCYEAVLSGILQLINRGYGTSKNEKQSAVVDGPLDDCWTFVWIFLDSSSGRSCPPNKKLVEATWILSLDSMVFPV